MQFGKYFIDLSQPQVMGILNVTPDSFSDGGKHTNVSQSLDHALRMIEEGATFIDIGGESTRPGAPDVSLQEELDRTIPVIEAVAKNTSCVISIDTSKADVTGSGESRRGANQRCTRVTRAWCIASSS